MRCKQEDKVYTGSLPSPSLTGSPIYRKGSLGSEDNWNPAQTPDTYTGNSVWPCPRKVLFKPSRLSSETVATQNSPDQTQPMRMSGRMTPEWKGPSSSSEYEPSNETTPQTGSASGTPPLPVISYPSLPIYEYIITGLSEQLARTTHTQLQWSGLAMYSSVRLVLASQGLLGNELDWKLMLKIPTQNSGAVTLANELLLSMNFVVASMSLTYLDGLTVTQLTWRLKDRVSRYLLVNSGSPPTWTWNFGTLNSMDQL